jgi:hypothetical protein
LGTRTRPGLSGRWMGALCLQGPQITVGAAFYRERRVGGTPAPRASRAEGTACQRSPRIWGGGPDGSGDVPVGTRDGAVRGGARERFSRRRPAAFSSAFPVRGRTVPAWNVRRAGHVRASENRNDHLRREGRPGVPARRGVLRASPGMRRRQVYAGLPRIGLEAAWFGSRTVIRGLRKAWAGQGLGGTGPPPGHVPGGAPR